MSSFRVISECEECLAQIPKQPPVSVESSDQKRERRDYWDIDEFKTIYQDEFIKITWNPLYKQPSFTVFSSPNVVEGISSDTSWLVRGGFSIMNQSHNGTFAFQYLVVKDLEYFFSSSTGNSGDIDTNFDVALNWNRCKLWLSSVYEDFPYYDLRIYVNSNRGVLDIKIYDARDP